MHFFLSVSCFDNYVFVPLENENSLRNNSHASDEVESMVWTDSQDYGSDEILYTTRNVLIDKTNRLMC